MSKKNIQITLISIIVLVFLTGNLCYPKYFDKGADFLNQKLSLGVPHFFNVPFRMGLDLQGGIHLIYEADLSNVEKKDYHSSLEGLRDVIERRVNLFGVQEPKVQIQTTGNHHRLAVELAGIKDPAQAIKEIGKTPFLEFKEERGEDKTKEILAKQEEVKGKSFEEAQKIENWQLALEDPYFKSTSLTGKYLEKAEISFDNTTYNPLVLLQFDKEGANIFKDLTSKNLKKRLAIYIDNAPISSPVVQEVISGGRAQISGKFTIEEAKELSRNLNAGALPIPIELISQQNVGPILGAMSVKNSLKAGIVGFCAVLLFLIIFYRFPGFLAGIALMAYITIVLSIFKLIPVTITLAGIGGFILSLGMAVDANILIFSRSFPDARGRKIKYQIKRIGIGIKQIIKII
ncbi:MAG: protein translocase subunit SecD, partial [Patescibacteria group bacterium]|nr:protein translocase subunit SecD [Patescibacteria group bacterium]